MILTDTLIKKITDALKEDRAMYDKDKTHAIALGLQPSVYSNIINGKIDKKLSLAVWVGIARRLNVQLRDEIKWNVANTATYQYIYTQLKSCQYGHISAVLCDIPNIGKTFTAKAYVRENKNAIYVDCSQVKTKRNLVRYIAKEFGVSTDGKYSEMYKDLVAYLNVLDYPLIILDEAGDLQYEAFLELKALWNATERMCGWYMMGADGLQNKIDRAIEGKKVGFAEIYSRYGGKYQRATPLGAQDREKYLHDQAMLVAKVNALEGMNVEQISRQSQGSLRRVYIEIEKARRVA